MRWEMLPAEEILVLLKATPRRVKKLTDGVADARLTTPPSEGEWSVNEILAHLRASADVRGKNIMTMLQEDHPTIRAVSPRAWMRKTDYLDLAFRPSLRAYTQQRKELLAVMASLPPRAWSRGGTFTRSGERLERTVHFEADSLATHDRDNVEQIAQVLESLS